MRKKITALIALAAMIMTMLPSVVFADVATVKTEADFKAALEAGGDIVLGNNIELTETHVISKETAIDLNGKTLSSKVAAGKFVLTSNVNATVTITNGVISSPEGRGVGAWDGTLNLNGVTINSAGRGLGVYDAATVNIDKDSVLNTKAGPRDAGIIVWGDEENNKKPTLNLYGKVTNDGETFAISGNGSDFSGTTVNIYAGAEVKTTSKTAPAIYHPQPGKIMIDGHVEGGNGIEVRAGDLTVNPNAVIISTADEYISKPNGNGSTAIGAAIAVNQHTTKRPIKVVINGGDISGPAALISDDVQGAAEDVNVNILMGAFEGKVTAAENGGKIVVEGGAFTDLDERATTVTATDIVTISDGTETIKVVSLGMINDVLAAIAEESPEELANLTVTIEKAAPESKFAIPSGVTVVNKSGGDVQVNDDVVENGDKVKIETPTKPEDPQTKPETKPEAKPETESPKTSDDMVIIPFVVLMMAAAGLVFALKRKEDQ